MKTPAQDSPKPENEKPLDNKSLRTIEAILCTGYDAETKVTLMTMAMDLNTKRPDWAVWRGRPSLARRTSLGLDVLSKIRAFIVKEGLVSERKKPHPLQIKKAKKAKGFDGRPASCFDFHIEHLESLGFHDEKITLRDSRAKHRLQARQDAIRRRLEEADHAKALRDDLARNLREIRRRHPIVDGKRTDFSGYDRMTRTLIKALVLREPERGVRHADLVRTAARMQQRRQEEQE